MGKVRDAFSREYSEHSFWEKVKCYGKAAGVKVVYIALLLFYALQRPDIPKWSKGVIVGAIGYFISPLDIIIDPTPFIGYSDDLLVLFIALLQVAFYIDRGIKQKAKDKLENLFGDLDPEVLNEIDARIKKEKQKAAK